MTRAGPPPLTVVLGPSGSGKTSYCLDLLRARDGAGVLVVPGRQVSAVRALHGAIGSSILSSRELVSRIALHGDQRNELASSLQQRLLLERACRESIREGDALHKVLEVPGCLEALHRFLRELRMCAGRPEHLEALAQERSVQDSDSARRCAEIARIWRVYEQRMADSHLLDEEDQLIAAAGRLRMGDSSWLPGKHLVLVDGYYRIQPLWADFLEAAALAGREVVITLPYEEDRTLLFAASRATLEQLEARFNVKRVVLPSRPRRNASLQHIERHLFGGTPSERPTANPAELLILDAPEPYAEAEMVARELIRAHGEGVAWGRCGVVVRSLADYGPLLRGVLAVRYGIPVHSMERRSLLNETLVRAAMTMLEALASDWPRDLVITYLKSSSVDAAGVSAELMDRAARRAGLRRGREQWRALCEALPDDSRPVPDALTRLFEVDSRLGDDLRAPSEWCGLVHTALHEAGLLSPARAGDRPAAARLADVLGHLASVEEDKRSSPISLGEFVAILQSACAAAAAPEATEQEQAVHLLEPEEASGRGLEVVILAGLLERAFPRRVAENPFLRDEERAALARLGDLRLPLSSQAPDDERLLFYLAVSAPSRRLVLAFPRSGETSDQLPSFFLDEVRGLFEHVSARVRTLADVAPALDEAIDQRERLLAACAQYAVAGHPAQEHNPPIPRPDRPPFPRIRLNTVEEWPGLHTRVAVRDLEIYLRCPFVWFAECVLQLRTTQDSLSGAVRGSLYHRILAHRYRMHAGGPGDTDPARLKQELLEAMETVLAGSVLDAADYEIALLRQWLEDALARFAEREAHLARIFGLRPSHFELAFGEPIGPIDEDGSETPSAERDPASVARPLRLEGEPVVDVCGVLDRVDLSGDGLALVLDYKTGSTPEARRLRQGASLQLPLYMLAAERLFGWTPVVGAMDSPRDAGRKRVYRATLVGNTAFAPVSGVEAADCAQPLAGSQYEEMVEQARKTARDAALGMRQAVIAPKPGDHCQTCAYGDLCRTNRAGEHDGEPAPSAVPGGAGNTA